jgi:muconate cycloisomerase
MEIQWFDGSSASRGPAYALVCIRDGQDAFGLGEIAPEEGGVTAATLQLLGACAERLASVERRNINVALDTIGDLTARDRGAGPAVRAALDMALHDLIGKGRGVPVHALLGGARRTVFTLTESFGEAPDPATLASDASLRLIISSQQAGGTEDWIAPAIDSMPDHVQIDIDASECFDNPALARVFVEGLLGKRARLNLGLIQPLREADLLGHAELRATVPVPIIIDRSLRSAGSMAQIVRMGAVDRVVANIDRLGGLREAMRVASLAEASATGVTAAGFARTSVGAAAILHFAATLHDTFPVMMAGLAADTGGLSIGGITREGNSLRLVGGPGLGLAVPQDVLGAFRPLV